MTPADGAVRVACPTCGFTAGSLPTDGLVAEVMAIPGQYRELLASFGSLEEIDDLLRDRCSPTAWSSLERIAHVADWLHLSAKHAVTVVEGDRDSFAPVHVDAPRAGSNGMPSRVVLASLHAATTDLARVVSRAGPELWECRDRVGEHQRSVRELLDNVLHEAQHHLADVEASLGTAAYARSLPA